MNKSINQLIYDFKIDKKYWHRDSLSGEEYDNERSKPAPYLRTTMEIAKLLKMKTVVEIGSTRFAVTQKCVDYFYEEPTKQDAYKSPPCCCDGHATYFWAKEGFETYTVDIDINCMNGVLWSYSNLKENKPENLHPNIPSDGISFLENFQKNIDVLYLDGWDKGTPEYAENHLKAYMAAKDKLSGIHLILIDDTDFVTSEGGKDHLLSPYLIESGYDMLFNGRQTLFINRIY